MLDEIPQAPIAPEPHRKGAEAWPGGPGEPGSNELSEHASSLLQPSESSAADDGSETAPPEAADAPTPTALPRAMGNLLVLAEPWAEVYLDGELMGTTPLPQTRVSAGAHEIVVKNTNFVGVFRERVHVPENDVLRKSYSFHEEGFIQAVVTPWADVYVDGEHVGQTPLPKFAVVPGRHSLRFEHPTLGEKSSTVEVRRGETLQIKVEM